MKGAQIELGYPLNEIAGSNPSNDKQVFSSATPIKASSQSSFGHLCTPSCTLCSTMEEGNHFVGTSQGFDEESADSSPTVPETSNPNHLTSSASTSSQDQDSRIVLNVGGIRCVSLIQLSLHF